MNRFSLLMTAFATCLVSTSGTASVIENDAILIPQGPNSYSFQLTQSTSGGGFYAVGIDHTGGDEFLFYHQSIAELIYGFDTPAGTILDPNYAMNNLPLVDNNGQTGTINLALDDSFYFGYFDDRNLDDVPDAGDNYGWARITRTANGLVIDGSATALGKGIVVGTSIQVPEPTACVMLVVIGGITLVRRVRQQL